MWRIIKLIQAFMVVLVTLKSEQAPFKNEGARGSQKIFHCESMHIFMTLKGS